MINKLRAFRDRVTSSSLLASAIMVRRTQGIVSVPSPFGSLLSDYSIIMPSPDHLATTSLEILCAIFSRTLSTEVTKDMLASLRPSSTRQYQSHWRAFQRFLKARGRPPMSEVLVVEFLSFLGHKWGRSSATIANNIAVLADPLK